MNILLEIIGSQQIDNQKDKMELTTVGTFEENEDIYIINYSEEQEPPIQPVNVCIKINKNEKAVEMTRTGAYNSCLIIEKSKRNLCSYGTEYGDILMGISGHHIDCDYNNETGKFNFEYDIDINGALASRNKVKINFRKNQE
ncbi:MAG: DUF1934 domain-containing protein [Eubacterium sp.]|nr:DUF1934 domain-containing protein [Eubacterium sp.]